MIKVFVHADSRYKVDTNFIRSVVLSVLEKHKVKGKVEVEVAIVGDRRMQELNKTFRNTDETTNVLAFPLEDVSFEPQTSHKGFVNPPDKVLRLGDVVISYPQAAESAAEHNVILEQELTGLIEHGVLHLLGIHHQ